MAAEPSLIAELENQIEAVLNEQGPLIGKKIIEAIGTEDFINVWKACYQSNRFRVVNCARYYLRYDVTRKNQLRLSPSVLRDFLSFSLIHLSGQEAMAVEKGAILANKHRIISLKKLRVARQALLSLEPATQKMLNERACCFIAGDTAYFLAHEEPRLHKQVETIVHGSDIDILIVHDDDLEQSVVEDAEKQFLAFKFRALKDIRIGQEVDFLFKPVKKMKSQFNYSDIHEKIACKILYESFFLYGRLDMYEQLLLDLSYCGTVDRIETDFRIALVERKNTIGKILKLVKDDQVKMDPEIESLFYFSQERLEFQ